VGALAADYLGKRPSVQGSATFFMSPLATPHLPPRSLASPAASATPAVERCEYIRAGKLALVRVSGPSPLIATAALIALHASTGAQRFAPLPDLVLGEGEGAYTEPTAWRAAWAVPLELIEGDSAFALETREGWIMLAPPVERRLAGGCETRIEVRGGRTYLRILAGIVTAALIPVVVPQLSPGGVQVARAAAPIVSTRVAPSTAAPAAEAAPTGPEAQATSTIASSPTPTPPAASPAPAPQPAPQPPVAAQPKPAPAPHRAPRPAPRVVHPRPKAPQPKPKHAKPKHAKPKHAPAAKHGHARPHQPTASTPGAPSTAAPGPSSSALSAVPGSAIPNVPLGTWDVPAFLLPIYQAAGSAYGVPWPVLAAINKIETNDGRNLAVSTAGAMGWMQFMPSTWALYGLDASGDGLANPNDPKDAIFAAARYLAAAGAGHDVRRAVFAYNHAGWYVDEVMREAQRISSFPPSTVDAMAALTRGRVPVVGAVDVRHPSFSKRGVVVSGNAGAPVVSSVDGKVVAIGHSAGRGNYVIVQDAFGNRFSYAHLGRLSASYPVMKSRGLSGAEIRRQLGLPPSSAVTGPAPSRGGARASARKPFRGTGAGRRVRRSATDARRTRALAQARARSQAANRQRVVDMIETGLIEEKTPASNGLIPFVRSARSAARPPARPARRAAARTSRPQVVRDERDATVALRLLGMRSSEASFVPLKRGSRVAAGTLLGRLGNDPRLGGRPSMYFRVRPAGQLGKPLDPAPIIRGWQLLRRDVSHPQMARAVAVGMRAHRFSLGADLMLEKERLARRLLGDRRVEIYPCGRRDIATGQIDARVLSSLEFLADSGLHPTVTGLKCGSAASSRHPSERSIGAAVDIAAINGTPIGADQGPRTVAGRAIRRLLGLQGTLKPDRIVSLKAAGHADNSVAQRDHADHISIGFSGDPVPAGRVGAAADRLDRMRLPYVWGGGHVTPAPENPFPGLDCSSSVSWVLQHAGLSLPTMVAGDFMSYGEAGPGKNVTIYANPGHVFMSIGGRFFGTSGFGHPGAGTGPAWFTRQPDPGYLAGFTQRHPPGL